VRILLVLMAGICAAQSVAIRMESGVFRVDGWQAGAPPPDGWQSVFSVHAGESDAPAMFGSYSVEGGTLVFRPRFPVAPGMHVRAVFRPAGVEAKFDVPKAAPLAPSTRVEHVYPSIDVLPENQLKFYIYFSATMSKGSAWQKIHLVDDKGAAVKLPLLEIDEELWDPETRRLTVLFDPGRIKREVLPLREIGPSIQEGRRYALVIDRDWLDGRGAPLVSEFRKAFRVVAPDRTPPETSTWQVKPPRAGTRDPLVIDFPEPMDFALLHHLIEIPGVSGNIAVDKQETEWRFTPAAAWKAGDFQLVVQTTLEDLAGNHIGRPFDVDTFEKVTPTIERETVSVPFRIVQ